MSTTEIFEKMQRPCVYLADFLSVPFAAMSSGALLSYFQNRTHIHYFPLSQGNPKQVIAAEKILNNEFEFNNEIHRLKEHFDWKSNPSRDIEWLILLHKFYYVKDLAGAYDYTCDELFAGKWVNLISSWIEQTPVGFIDSQVTGRRLQQWLLAYHYFVPKCRSESITPNFVLTFIGSINSQAHYLCRHLTPEGNHRTIELYAIFLVAVIFPELEASVWFLQFATQELIKNLGQDFLTDGVHRELSTDYHHIVLKNFLRIQTLATLNKIELPKEFGTIIEKALQFSLYVHKPDGFIPAINDGDINSYLSLLKKAYKFYPSEALLYAASQGRQGTPPSQRSNGFTDSGYFVLRSDWSQQPYEDALYLFFDCGSLGFGSHGHYDLLSFEMAAYGHSLIVDPGRYTYNENSEDGINWRRIFKGTAYHNTIVIDEKNQAPYRCGRPEFPEPQATLKKFVTAEGFDFLHGQALTYEYKVTHERMIFFAAQEYWLINDCLHGDGADHSYDMYLHLSPKANNQTNVIKEAASTIINIPNLIIAQSNSAPAIEILIEEGFVSTEYGIKEEAPIIKFSQSSCVSTCFHTVLYPFRDLRPGLQITQLIVYQNGQICDHTKATALNIILECNATSYDDIFFIAEAPSVEADFVFSDIKFRGHVLFLRRDHSGRITNLQGIGIDLLEVNSTIVLQGLKESEKVSFQNNRLELSEINGIKHLRLENCDVFPEWSDLSKHWYSK